MVVTKVVEYDKLEGAEMWEYLNSDGGAEIGSSGGIQGWNIEVKLEGSSLGESLGLAVGTQIASPAFISCGKVVVNIKGSEMGDSLQ